MRLFVCLFLLATASVEAVFAQRPQRYESKNFLVRTDLPKEKADELLAKLETMLGLMSKYWAVPNRKQIECVVVGDLKNWPAGSIDSRAMPRLQSGGGLTVAQSQTRGNRTTIQAIAYASARDQTVQHEAVHAFSYYSFGTCGPEWYSEGMAEIGAYWVEGTTAVTAPGHVTRFLRNTESLTVRDITTSRTDNNAAGWKTYASRWALCHLLSNNDNYSTKFRPLGLNMLSKRRASFKGTYGSVMRELEFEFAFFLKHVEPGYEVNRCRWDWDARFRKLKPGKRTTKTVKADHGWQPTRLRVEEDVEYTFKADGTWKLSEDDNATSANGLPDGSGRLEGVIMTSMNLGDSFPLGATGSFKATASGDLYVRCVDGWASLADNSGEVELELELAK